MPETCRRCGGPFVEQVGDVAGKDILKELGASMRLRATDVGALSNAGPLEGITAVLATINRRNKVKDAGIKITGI